MSEPSTESAPARRDFVATLEALRESGDRGALATLRRGLADVNGDFTIYRIIGRAMPNDLSEWEESCYRLVACLYAAHQDNDDSADSLGASAHLLWSRLGDGGNSLDIRFTALLNAEAEDLPVRLRHLFSQLAAQDVPVNYRTLLNDLRYWTSERRTTQRRWARDYWAQEQEDPSDTPSVPTAEQNNVQA